MRAALGATRGRLFVEQLIDSAVLATAGSLAGVWIAYGLIKVVARYQQFFLPRLAPIGARCRHWCARDRHRLCDRSRGRVLPRSVVSAVPSDALRSARGGSGDIKVAGARSALVVAQMAIALVLLVGAGLLVRTVQHLSQRQLGFDSEQLTWLQVNLPGRKYRETEPQVQFERDVLERLRQIPSVTSAMASVGFPLWGGMMAGLASRVTPGTPRREVAYLSISPELHRRRRRTDRGRPRAAVDRHPQRTARRGDQRNDGAHVLAEGNAIGAEVQIGPGSPNQPWITVVGVMADMRAHGVAEPIGRRPPDRRGNIRGHTAPSRGPHGGPRRRRWRPNCALRSMRSIPRSQLAS